MNIIQDELISPFSILMDEDNYSVVKFTNAVRSDGRAVKTTHGYFHTLGGAIRKITRLKSLERDDEVTLSEYVNRIEDIGNRIMDRLKL